MKIIGLREFIFRRETYKIKIQKYYNKIINREGNAGKKCKFLLFSPFSAPESPHLPCLAGGETNIQVLFRDQGGMSVFCLFV
jgi:hypothetical protein